MVVRLGGPFGDWCWDLKCCSEDMEVKLENGEVL